MSDTTLPQHIRPLPRHLPVESHAEFGHAPDLMPVQTSSETMLREYFRILLKYRTLIIACVVLCTLLSLLYAFTATPLYTAQSKLRISTYEPVLTATKIEDMLQEKSRESNYLETQIQELKSFSLADKILQDPEVSQALSRPSKKGLISSLFFSEDDVVVEDQGLKDRYSATLQQIQSYLNLVDVRPVRRTSLVGIDVTVEDPRLAALIANKHALAYIDWVRESRIEQQTRGLAFLRAQSEELREKVADLERELADYAEANSIVALNKDENIVAQKMSQLNQLLTSATAKRIEAENMFKEAEAALLSPSAGFDDPSTQVMRSELAKLEAEYQQLSAKFTAQYPRVQQLKSQIDGLRGSIEGQRKQIVLGLKAKMMAAQQEEKNLLEELEQQKSQAFELSKRQVQYNILNRELTTSRDLLENVLKQIKETSLTVESNASNVSIVDYAVTPNSPSYPRKKLLLALGVILGLACGVGLAFLLSYLDNTVRTPEDLTQVLRIPSLGVVPSFDGQNSFGGGEEGESHAAEGAEASGVPAPPMVQQSSTDGGGSHLPIAFLSDPKSLASEAYRTIRTGLLLSQAGEPPRTILVSSAQSSEGKTTSTINLAASLASSGGRVVLIDADLRRPSIHKHLRLDSNQPGLVEVLTGQLGLADVIRPDVVKRISVITSGGIPPNPAELLGSIEMANVLDELSRNFDYVLIDSPPILPITDSVILSRYVDGVVLVVRGASTPRKVVADAKARLQSVGARFLGAILNDVDVASGDYYYYNRYYYSYYEDERPSRKRRAQA